MRRFFDVPDNTPTTELQMALFKRTTMRTDPNTLVRSDAPDTSRDAAFAVDTTRLEFMVYETIGSFGEKGCISDEVRSRFPNYPYSSITARYKSLLDKDLIEDTGVRRAGSSGRGQRVLRMKRKVAL